MRRLIPGKAIALLALVGAFMLVTVMPTEAALSLRLTDGITTITIDDGEADGGGDDDINAVTGAITFSGVVGSFVVNVSTGIGTPVFTPGHMDLNSVNVSPASGGTGTFDIFFSENGFSTPNPGSHMELLFGGTLSAPAGSSVQAILYSDDSDALFGTTDTIGGIGPFSPGAFAGTDSGQIPPGYSTPYSLTQRISLIITGPTTYSGNFEVLVPEPASLAIFGLGLAGLAAFRRRQARRA